MGTERLREQIENYHYGRVSLDKLIEEIQKAPYTDMDFACVDHHRSLRQSLPEVIYCKGKSTQQIVCIARELYKNNKSFMATKASPDVYDTVKDFFPKAEYHKDARLISCGQKPDQTKKGVLIVTAGTADIPAAEEAALVSEWMGQAPDKAYDIGVAGLHRFLQKLDIFFDANVVVVVAGMDGVLPSVVGGIVNIPVIAVPTSTGYGANFDGLAPLLTMLNSCSPGISVVNIDNGFGAGYQASLINELAYKRKS